MRKFKTLFTLCIALLVVSTTMAREIYPLNDSWQFFFRSENDSEHARLVSLPHSWNNNPMAGSDFRETTANYLNEIFIPLEWSSKRLFLRFGGAQSVANVFVNGLHVGEHKGGATAFTFEITNQVRVGTNNTIQVVVSNNYRSDVLPVSTDINLYGGLYRGVELIVTDREAISPCYLGTQGVLVYPTEVDETEVRGEVEVRLSLTPQSDITLRVEWLNSEGKTVFTRSQRVRGAQQHERVPFHFKYPQLWRAEDPHLYTVVVTIEGEGSRDQVKLRTGFRTLTIDKETGWLAINGEVQQLRGVVMHHDNSSGGTPTRADFDLDLDFVHDLGATAIRSAVMPHDPYLYDCCDEQGLLAWVDLPLHRAPFMGDTAYYSTTLFEQNGVQQLREIIAQNMHHPSIVMWGLFSRLQLRGEEMLAYLKRLNEEAHRLDPTRPTVACSDQDGEINFITDLIAWRQEVGWRRGSAEDLVVWRAQLREHWSHLHSAVSYGGEGFLGMSQLGVQRTKDREWVSERAQARFHEEYCRHLEADSLFWGIWIENLFEYGSARRPYGLNGEGLVSLNRNEKKDAYYLYRALWNQEQPTVHLVNRRYRMRRIDRQAFTVYSSAGDPVLLLHDDTVAMHRYAPCQYRSDTVTLGGNVQVRVSAGGLGDGTLIQIGSVLRPQQRLVPLQKADLQTID
ncbi:MAG: beta-galactosidase [Alistipes sp.]|nr:beta-galactosidase [Alistipes sp.]